MSIDWAKVKVFEMGEPIRIEDIPEEELTLEEQFLPVAISAKAIDLASQLVPERVWKRHGIHTWLSMCAGAAFRRMKVGEREIKSGRMHYYFEYSNREPVLQKIAVD